MAIERAIVIQKMKQAFKEGLSAAAFIRQMRAEGLGYRHTTMRADWRSASGLEEKKGLLRYVRRDYQPSRKAIAEVSWKLSTEYMYQVRVYSRTRPTEPILWHMINISRDNPLTIAQIEAEAWELIKTQSPPKIEQVVSVVPWSAMKRVPE